MGRVVERHVDDIFGSELSNKEKEVAERNPARWYDLSSRF